MRFRPTTRVLLICTALSFLGLALGTAAAPKAQAADQCPNSYCDPSGGCRSGQNSICVGGANGCNTMLCNGH